MTTSTPPPRRPPWEAPAAPVRPSHGTGQPPRLTQHHSPQRSVWGHWAPWVASALGFLIMVGFSIFSTIVVLDYADQDYFNDDDDYSYNTPYEDYDSYREYDNFNDYDNYQSDPYPFYPNDSAPSAPAPPLNNGPMTGGVDATSDFLNSPEGKKWSKSLNFVIKESSGDISAYLKPGGGNKSDDQTLDIDSVKLCDALAEHFVSADKKSDNASFEIVTVWSSVGKELASNDPLLSNNEKCAAV